MKSTAGGGMANSIASVMSVSSMSSPLEIMVNQLQV